jgi:hypothetical protein
MKKGHLNLKQRIMKALKERKNTEEKNESALRKNFGKEYSKKILMI